MMAAVNPCHRVARHQPSAIGPQKPQKLPMDCLSFVGVTNGHAAIDLKPINHSSLEKSATAVF